MLRAPFFRVLFLCLLAVGIAFTGPASVSSIGAASLYYVSAEGCDNNDGRSPENAWRSLNRIGRHSLQPGDGVFFRRGDTWRNQLTVSSAGAAGAPVRYGTYGKGPLPRIAGTVPVAPTVTLSAISISPSSMVQSTTGAEIHSCNSSPPAALWKPYPTLLPPTGLLPG